MREAHLLTARGAAPGLLEALLLWAAAGGGVMSGGRRTTAVTQAYSASRMSKGWHTRCSKTPCVSRYGIAGTTHGLRHTRLCVQVLHVSTGGSCGAWQHQLSNHICEAATIHATAAITYCSRGVRWGGRGGTHAPTSVRQLTNLHMRPPTTLTWNPWSAQPATYCIPSNRLDDLRLLLLLGVCQQLLKPCLCCDLELLPAEGGRLRLCIPGSATTQNRVKGWCML
jgi:hypothetical protein